MVIHLHLSCSDARPPRQTQLHPTMFLSESTLKPFKRDDPGQGLSSSGYALEDCSNSTRSGVTVMVCGEHELSWAVVKELVSKDEAGKTRAI